LNKRTESEELIKKINNSNITFGS